MIILTRSTSDSNDTDIEENHGGKSTATSHPNQNQQDEQRKQKVNDQKKYNCSLIVNTDSLQAETKRQLGYKTKNNSNDNVHTTSLKELVTEHLN